MIKTTEILAILAAAREVHGDETLGHQERSLILHDLLIQLGPEHRAVQGQSVHTQRIVSRVVNDLMLEMIYAQEAKAPRLAEAGDDGPEAVPVLREGEELVPDEAPGVAEQDTGAGAPGRPANGPSKQKRNRR